MKPVLVKLNEINKYVLDNYKKDGSTSIEVLDQIQELLWQVWDVITLEKYVKEREMLDNASN
jgi:Zn-dependent oligopeptidase